MAPNPNRGRVRLGLVIFVVLLILTGVMLLKRYTGEVTRINNEGIELMNKGDYEAALEKLDQAVAIDPDNVQANYHRGICLAERRRFEDALVAFDRSIELSPREALAFFNKGKVLWYLNRFQDAIAPLQQATELKNPYPEAWLVLGDSFYELYLERLVQSPEQPGMPTQAEAAFKTYLEQRPEALDRRQVERKLDILAHPDKYPQVIENHRDRLESQKAEAPDGGTGQPAVLPNQPNRQPGRK